MESLLLTFSSVSYTMKAETLLTEKGYPIKIIPTPRQISDSCGLSIQMNYQDVDKVKEMKEELSVANLWKFIKNEGQVLVEQVG